VLRFVIGFSKCPTAKQKETSGKDSPRSNSHPSLINEVAATPSLTLVNTSNTPAKQPLNPWTEPPAPTPWHGPALFDPNARRVLTVWKSRSSQPHGRACLAFYVPTFEPDTAQVRAWVPAAFGPTYFAPIDEALHDFIEGLRSLPERSLTLENMGHATLGWQIGEDEAPHVVMLMQPKRAAHEDAVAV
jgi:hypothetical protein